MRWIKTFALNFQPQTVYIKMCYNECGFIFVAEESVLCTPTSRETYERVSHTIPTLPPGFPAPLLFPEGLSSIETLLTNIQVCSVPGKTHTVE